MTYEKLIHNIREWLGQDGINLFRQYKKVYETVSPVFKVTVGTTIVPHAVHFREGMQVRNFLRDQSYCKKWNCHKLDNTWAEVINDAIKKKKT